MTIHKEGYKPIIIVLIVLCCIAAIINTIFPQQTYIHYFLYLCGLITFFFVLRFFRDPPRNTIINENNIISSADGKIVVIEEVEEAEYLKDKRIQVSVFMSPLDVHVNWYPISGIVKYKKHHNGHFHFANKPKSSYENERTTLVIEGKNRIELLMRQIAGIAARRIICTAKTNTNITQGDKLGIIKFGSRVDLFLPVTAKIKVKLNQQVIGGETIIASFE
ncbi:MAG: phosphatidylserine decarboxylase family protein [Bacteroidales bacterium]|nr:phosphatidylserine decarboxylase family protein [Bacteroidales bacterium]